MTATRSMPVTGWLPLQEAAAGFREECASLEQLVSELYAEVDRLSEGLAAKAEELEEGRRRLAERGRQLAAERKETTRLSQQLDQHETQLAAAMAEIRALREEFARQPQAAKEDKDQPNELLRQQITDLQVERATLLERLRTAAELPNASVVDKVHTEGTAEVSALQQQRQELEQALEAARARCTELQATVDGQKQELSQHRSQVSEELKELRTLIEEQTMLLVPSEESSQALDKEEAHAARPHQSSAPAEDPKQPDPLVNSVMAQFAKLQRDISQRRKKK